MSEPDYPRYSFQPLADKNQLRAFSCGLHDIDKWARKAAWANHHTLRSRVTTLHDAADGSLVGVYSVFIALVSERTLSRQDRFQRHPSNSYFAAMRLEWIGVQQERQGCGIGTVAMGRVIATFREAAQSLALPVLVVHAANERAAGFYQRMGFGTYGLPGGRDYLLPAQSVMELPPEPPESPARMGVNDKRAV